MRLTVHFQEAGKPKKINFLMPDEFEEKRIKREARKEIKRRWPDVLRFEHTLTWRY